MNSSFGDPATHQDRDLCFEITLGVRVPVRLGQLHRHAHGAAARDDRDLVQRIRAGQESRDDRVTGFVIGAVDAIELAQRDRPALDAHQHLVARFLQVVIDDHRTPGAPGEERRLVHQIGEVGAREPRRSAGDRPEVDLLVDHDLAGVDAKDGLAPLEIRVADGDLTIEASRPQQRRVEDVLPIRRRDDDDAAMTFEAVHFDQELIQRLLALFMTQGVAAASPADGIQLVDEDNACGMAPGVTEQATDAGGADTGIHFDEVGSAGEQERDARFAGNRAGEERLARAWRADEQHAARNPAAERRVAARLAQEIGDLLDLVLGLVDSGDVLKCDHIAAPIGHARPRRHRRDAASGGAVHREAEQRKERRRSAQCRPAQRARVSRRQHIDSDAALDQIGDEGRVRAEEVARCEGLQDAAILQQHANRRVAETHLRDVV